MLIFQGCFKNKNNKKKKNVKRLSFITQFKIEFLLRLPVLVVEKFLGKCLGIEIFGIYVMKGLDLFFRFRLGLLQCHNAKCEVSFSRL